MTCEWRRKINLYVDDELAPAAQEEVSTHVKSCAECTAAMVEQMELKKAIRVAGQRFSAPPELRASIRKNMGKTRTRSWGWRWGLATACLLLLVCLAFVYFSIPKESNSLLAEVVDQHITSLASQSPVDVVSTDRHTVKPWFQGRIPFSFNLPELADSLFALIGGKTAYLAQNPGAELLYEVRKHRISVFIFQSNGGEKEMPSPDRRFSFTVAAWSQAGLQFYLFTDAPSEDANHLVSMFKEANRS